MTSFAADTPHYARFIASELLAARRARGLTQTDVARLAHVRTATVCRAENEPQRMVLDSLMQIAAALDLTITLTPADPAARRPQKPRLRSV